MAIWSRRRRRRGNRQTLGASRQFRGIPISLLSNIANLLTLVNGGSNSLHSHAVPAHTIASHSDTSGTGPELDTLTDGSDAAALHKHVGAALIETGTYTGDGETSKAVSLSDASLVIKYIRIWERTEANATDIAVYESSDTIVDDNASGLAIEFVGTGPTGPTSRINAIIAVGTGSFTVDDAGTDNHPNKNSQVYNYVVMGVES